MSVPKSLLGHIVQIAALPAAIIGGSIGGVAEALNGGTFERGYTRVADDMIEAAGKLGDDPIMKTVAGIGAGLIASELAFRSLNRK